MGWFKSQMWKVIDWKDDGNDTMVYRFQMPSDKYEIMSGSKLTVRESQVAVFVHKGKIADIFQPGQYTLSTNNLPVLSGLRALLYQGRDVVVKSDVYFVNTKQFTNLKWGTKNPITMRDADFRYGESGGFRHLFHASVRRGEIFEGAFRHQQHFTVADINDHLKSLLVSQMADTVAESKIPMLDMAANLQEFSAMCRTNITEKFREYGLDITSFTIENISLPQEVEKVLDERTSLGILGDKMGTYTQKKAADALGDAARNTGTVGTFMGVGMGGAFGNAMNNAFSNLGNAQDAAPSRRQSPSRNTAGSAERLCPWAQNSVPNAAQSNRRAAYASSAEPTSRAKSSVPSAEPRWRTEKMLSRRP